MSAQTTAMIMLIAPYLLIIFFASMRLPFKYSFWWLLGLSIMTLSAHSQFYDYSDFFTPALLKPLSIIMINYTVSWAVVRLIVFVIDKITLYLFKKERE